jgi:hypothetical protein
MRWRRSAATRDGGRERRGSWGAAEAEAEVEAEVVVVVVDSSSSGTVDVDEDDDDRVFSCAWE